MGPIVSVKEAHLLTTCFACLLPGRCFWCSNWKVDKWKGIMVHGPISLMGLDRWRVFIDWFLFFIFAVASCIGV